MEGSYYPLSKQKKVKWNKVKNNKGNRAIKSDRKKNGSISAKLHGK